MHTTLVTLDAFAVLPTKDTFSWLYLISAPTD